MNLSIKVKNINVTVFGNIQTYLLTLKGLGGGQMAHRVLKKLFLWNQKSDWPQTRLVI